MMNDFDMNESDLLFGNNDCIDEHIDDDEDDATESDSESHSEHHDMMKHYIAREHDMQTGIPTRQLIIPSAPSLMRSQSMPNNAKFLSPEDRKWRVKYLSALKIKSMAVEGGQDDAPSPLPNNIPRHSKMSPSVRGLTRKMSGPIEIPRRQSFDETPRGSMSSMTSIGNQDKSEERYRRNLTQYEQCEVNPHEFVPPHQMVQRDCFSLGMKHHFRPKQGNI